MVASRPLCSGGFLGAVRVVVASRRCGFCRRWRNNSFELGRRRCLRSEVARIHARFLGFGHPSAFIGAPRSKRVIAVTFHHGRHNFSSRIERLCSKARLTVLVPARKEPVTATIGDALASASARKGDSWFRKVAG